MTESQLSGRSPAGSAAAFSGDVRDFKDASLNSQSFVVEAMRDFRASVAAGDDDASHSASSHEERWARGSAPG